MSKVTGRPESAAEEALRAWLAEQELKSVDNVEAGARQLVTLVTALLGVLFAVMAVTDDPLPAYFAYPTLRLLGVGVVVLLLATLVAALVAVLPFPMKNFPHRPDKQREEFDGMLRRKSLGLYVAAVCFALGLILLGIILGSVLLLAG